MDDRYMFLHCIMLGASLTVALGLYVEGYVYGEGCILISAVMIAYWAKEMWDFI